MSGRRQTQSFVLRADCSHGALPPITGVQHSHLPVAQGGLLGAGPKGHAVGLSGPHTHAVGAHLRHDVAAILPAVQRARNAAVDDARRLLQVPGTALEQGVRFASRAWGSCLTLAETRVCGFDSSHTVTGLTTGYGAG